MTFGPGPVRGSFWIEPRLLAGPYPRDLDALRDVDVFLDLTGEDEGLEAYAAELGARARAVRRPIPDFGVPTVDQMVETLDALDRELAAGNVVYLHCHYGVGRTGTTLAAHLIRRGVPVDDALLSLREIGKGPEAPRQLEFLRRFAATAAGSERRMDVNPIDVQKHLKGMSYPASKDDVVARAESNGAPDEIVEQLRNASSERFDGPDDVMKALS